MSRLAFVAAFAALAIACGSSSTGKAGPAADKKPAADADAGKVVAKYEGGSVTAGELHEFSKDELKKLEAEYDQRVYDLKKGALEALIVKRLLEERAKKEGVAVEDFVKRELEAQSKPPSDEEMRALYDQAKAGGQQLPPYEQVKPQIQQYLANQRGQQALGAYYEKVKSDAKVQVLLQPKRVEVAAEGPSKGPADAPVTIVEFSDFECPFCTRGETVIAEVLKAYEGKVRVVFRDFPLPIHPNAPKAAEAAHCAGDQGKYWEMHGKLFANQKALDVPSLKKYAGELGIDQAKFDKCVDGGEKASVVADNKKAGDAAGVTGTPAFFVNGVLISGAQPFEAFKQIIDTELANAGATAKK